MAARRKKDSAVQQKKDDVATAHADSDCQPDEIVCDDEYQDDHSLENEIRQNLYSSHCFET